MTSRMLTDQQLGAIITGLATADVMRKKTLAEADAKAVNAPVYDELVMRLTEETRQSDALKQLLESAEQIELHMPD